MTDAGQPIYIDIQSSEIMAMEDANTFYRLNLGYIAGEFSHILVDSDLYIKVHYKRGLGMQWESLQFKLNKNRKYFKQKLPAGLTVTNFYVQLYGQIKPPDYFQLDAEFELTDFEISVKKIPVGKHAGEPLGLEIDELPIQEPFFMKLDLIGEVDAISAKGVVYTSRKANAVLFYGLTPNTMNSFVYSSDNNLTGKYHEFKLLGLLIDTTYYAQFRATNVKTGEQIVSKIHAFRTGREITVINTLYSPTYSSSKRTPMLRERTLNAMIIDERLLTLDPDNTMSITNSQQNSIKEFISGTSTNFIISSFTVN